MNKIFSCLFLFQIYTAASFSQMNQQWVSRYNGPGNYEDLATSITVDASGNVIVTGTSFDSPVTAFTRYATVKYNSSGDQQWLTNYYGLPDTSYIGLFTGTDPAGNIYVTGYIGLYHQTIATVKYNPFGAQEWVQRVPEGRPYAIAIDALGNVYITGWHVINPSQGTNYVTIKYNTSGVQQWISTYTYLQNFPGPDVASAIAIDNIGNVYITGSTYDSAAGGRFDMTTIKYNSSGSQQWVQRHTGNTSQTVASAILIDNIGNVIVTGLYTIKYNSSGIELWEKSSGYSTSMALDRSDNLYVASINTGAPYFSTIKKYSSSGDSLWGRGVISYAIDVPKIAFDNCLGYLYVTATKYDSTHNFTNYATVRYNSYGDSLWAGIYTGPLNSVNRPKAIMTDGLGNVYVTGESKLYTAPFTDYATVKYSPSSFFIHTAKKTNVGKAINDNQTTSDSIFIDCSLMNYTTADVNVKLNNITHTKDSDLEILLILNSATDNTITTDTLVYQAGGTGQNFTGTILNDSASAPISSGTAPFTGSFKPQKQLSQFNGQGISGTWILKIYDRATGNTGMLNSWSIDFLLSNNPIGIQNISNEIPNKFSLSQNYPNPFNPATNINFSIPEAAFVKLVVYDITGREVETLVNENLSAGTYNADWNAARYSSGVYFYKLEAGEFTETKKMVLVK